jgi:hypothetical protein
MDDVDSSSQSEIQCEVVLWTRMRTNLLCSVPINRYIHDVYFG